LSVFKESFNVWVNTFSRASMQQMTSSMNHTVQPTRPRPLRILLVDDHADTLAMMRLVLRHQDCEVVTAPGYEQGLQLGLTLVPDVLVSDIRLPDGSGWQLLERLKEAHPAVVGVAVSGAGTDADVARSERAGFCAHLTKPIDVAALRSTIERCAAESSGTNR
jgi:CheY-like chemotaxis protein